MTGLFEHGFWNCEIYVLAYFGQKTETEVSNHISKWQNIPAAQISSGPAFTHIVLFYKPVDSSIGVPYSDEGCYYHLTIYHYPAIGRAQSSNGEMVPASTNRGVPSFNNEGVPSFINGGAPSSNNEMVPASSNRKTSIIQRWNGTTIQQWRGTSIQQWRGTSIQQWRGTTIQQ